VPQLQGRGWWRIATLYRPLLLGLLALVLVFALERLILRRAAALSPVKADEGMAFQEQEAR
jgi:hypothetical protein